MAGRAFRRTLRALLAMMCVAWAPVARAQAPDYHAKVTFGNYYQGGNASLDTNLRYSRAEWTGWIGYYTSTASVQQARTGIEYDMRWRWLYLVPSVQAATHEFLGGTAYAEIGGSVYAIAGLSRTDLKPYVNLTFDPNESWQAGVGVHIDAQDTMSLYSIWDNRLGTGQQVTHFVLRRRLARSRRITVDASYKSGHGEGGAYMHGGAGTLEFDRGRWFTKIAGDQHANFAEATMWRLGGGFRF
jgi:hypothetical protein